MGCESVAYERTASCGLAQAILIRHEAKVRGTKRDGRINRYAARLVIYALGPRYSAAENQQYASGDKDPYCVRHAYLFV